MTEKRYIITDITDLSFASGKMAFVSGPRQCGKTTLAKYLLAEREFGCYYNWDELSFRKLWANKPLDSLLKTTSTTVPLVVYDEIHKAKGWKKNLKGVYDSMPYHQDILVTGSARLNVYRRGGDSLMGRYFHFRLHPFSLAELCGHHLEPQALFTALLSNQYDERKSSQEIFTSLFQYGGFPEPFFAASARRQNLWRRGRLEKIIREDLRDLSRLPELSQIEMLVALLPERSANVLSLSSLARDLEVAYTTVKRWMSYLTELYYCFAIRPYSKSLSRSLKKEAKLYLWDYSEIENSAARFENLLASHLLKYCHYWTDVGEGSFELTYLRNKEKKEIDFLITRNGKPWLPIEVKQSTEAPSENWQAFMSQLPCQLGVQVVMKPNVYQINDRSFGKIITLSAAQFLQYLI